jgi:hypothetical protein
MGRELDQRRLAILDSGRRPADHEPGAALRGEQHVAIPAVHPPGADPSVRPPGIAPTSVSPMGRAPSAAPPAGVVGADGIGDEPPLDRSEATMPLELGARARRWVLIAAATLAAGAVLATLLWPARVSQFFRINTAGVRSEGIDLSLESAMPDTEGARSSTPLGTPEPPGADTFPAPSAEPEPEAPE